MWILYWFGVYFMLICNDILWFMLILLVSYWCVFILCLFMLGSADSVDFMMICVDVVDSCILRGFYVDFYLCCVDLCWFMLIRIDSVLIYIDLCLFCSDLCGLMLGWFHVDLCWFCADLCGLCLYFVWFLYCFVMMFDDLCWFGFYIDLFWFCVYSCWFCSDLHGFMMILCRFISILCRFMLIVCRLYVDCILICNDVSWFMLILIICWFVQLLCGFI